MITELVEGKNIGSLPDPFPFFIKQQNIKSKK